jgi:hypothetical protein
MQLSPLINFKISKYLPAVCENNKITLCVWLTMPKSQQSWVRSQHPPTQHSGIWGLADMKQCWIKCLLVALFTHESLDPPLQATWAKISTCPLSTSISLHDQNTKESAVSAQRVIKKVFTRASERKARGRPRWRMMCKNFAKPAPQLALRYLFYLPQRNVPLFFFIPLSNTEEEHFLSKFFNWQKNIKHTV